MICDDCESARRVSFSSMIDVQLQWLRGWWVMRFKSRIGIPDARLIKPCEAETKDQQGAVPVWLGGVS
jgi:hypothetical protein